MKYPALGEKINYMRADAKTGALAFGVGIVRAIFLSEDQRPQVQVLDGENAWNIDLVAVNPTEETKKRYAALVSEVQKISAEGNELVKVTVSEYNEKVRAAYDRVLGAPVKVAQVEINGKKAH